MAYIIPRPAIAFCALVLGVVLLTACKDEGQSAQGEMPAMPQAEVTVYEVTPQLAEFSNVLPGRVAAYRVAEIRPQVGGIVQKRLFEQGTEVNEGQVLYQIDPAPFEAEQNMAAAAVKRAEAILTRAQAQTKRLKPLIDADAISGQSYDDAVAAELQADADLAQAKATLERRKLDVKFAAIASPIAGRIDQAIATEGALASTSNTSPMATVQQIDQVFVDVRQPSARLEQIREAASLGQDNQGADVRILSGDGKAMGVAGKLLFSGISVDPATGEVLTRVLVPNEKRILLPGMYVQAELPLKKIQDALMVPQQAVKRSATGTAQVYVVDNAGKATATDIVTGEIQNGWYMVSSGLETGKKIVIEGQDRIMPDVPVKTVPWKNPVEPAAQAEPAPAVETPPIPQDVVTEEPKILGGEGAE